MVTSIQILTIMLKYLRPIRYISVNNCSILKLRLKPLSQFFVQTRHAFVSVVIGKQAERKAVDRLMIDNAGTAFSIVQTGRFGTNALLHI